MRVFPDFQFGPLRLKLGLRSIEQEAIGELVYVKLDHVAFESNLVVAIPLHSLFQSIQLLQRTRHYTRGIAITLHCVGFPTTCLTVCEYAHVVPVERTLDEHPHIFEDALL